MKRFTRAALAVVGAAALVLSAGTIAQADSGTAPGGPGGNSGHNTSYGWWQIDGPRNGCSSNTLVKYDADGHQWWGESWSWNSPIANRHLLDQNIGAVDYWYQGQHYTSGSGSVTYGWIVQQEQGSYSNWSKHQPFKRDDGHVWVDRLDTGRAAGQLIWVCASAAQTTMTPGQTTSAEKHCIVGVQRKLDGGAWEWVSDNRGASNQALWSNCQTNVDYAFTSAGVEGSAVYNKDQTLQVRGVTRKITEITTRNNVYLYGQHIDTKITRSYNSTADVTGAPTSQTVKATKVSAGTNDLAYWNVDNKQDDGGFWIDKDGNEVPASDPNQGVQMIIGELWDNNSPVDAKWISLSEENRNSDQCWSEITWPTGETVTNPEGLGCVIKSKDYSLSSYKVVDGKTVNLMSFAPKETPNQESLTWDVTAEAGPEDIIDEVVVRSISSDKVTVDLSQETDVSQTVRYGGVVNFHVGIGGGGAPVVSADAPNYTYPYGYTYSTTVDSKILGGEIWTYTANNG